MSQLLGGLDSEKFDLTSPADRPERSSLVVISHRPPERNRAVYEALKAAGIDVSLRRGLLRFSPHLYNTVEEIERALEVLSEA